jgi:hypothetical protein
MMPRISIASRPKLRQNGGKVTKNERVTENLVRDSLRRLGYYEEESDIQVDEQKINIEGIKKLLRAAGKSGMGGKGAPEFIISSASNPDILIIVECKASAKDHASAEVLTDPTHRFPGETLELFCC